LGYWKLEGNFTGSSFEAWIKASYGFEKADVSTPLRSWNELLVRWAGVVILVSSSDGSDNETCWKVDLKESLLLFKTTAYL
jgi:hypothetical protein